MESRDMDQIALVTTKNNCWKELSWIIRQTLAGANGHKHGYSAGPVYGYLSNFAQVTFGGDAPSSEPLNFDNDYVEPVGFGAEGPDDGYIPFGYGDQGFGYGAAQQQYKEVQEVRAEMQAAWDLIVEQNEARIAAHEAELIEGHEIATADFMAALQAKWDMMQANIDAQNAAW